MWVGPNPIWLVSLKELRQHTDQGRTMWTYSRKAAIYKSKRKQPCWHLDLGLPASRTMRKINFCCLRQPVCGICYGSPSKLLQSPNPFNGLWGPMWFDSQFHLSPHFLLLPPRPCYSSHNVLEHARHTLACPLPKLFLLPGYSPLKYK